MYSSVRGLLVIQQYSPHLLLKLIRYYNWLCIKCYFGPFRIHMKLCNYFLNQEINNNCCNIAVWSTLCFSEAAFNFIANSVQSIYYQSPLRHSPLLRGNMWWTYTVPNLVQYGNSELLVRRACVGCAGSGNTCNVRGHHVHTHTHTHTHKMIVNRWHRIHSSTCAWFLTSVMLSDMTCFKF
jgi:hypothetical protein